jgi:predicted transposase/invertase (TIGR01784 family)
MPLGIRPINDFAFKKTFGTPENRPCLISLLNAILRLKEAIVEVTIDNPFNLQDFQDDKLSLLDIKAIDRTGAIYNVEVQLTTYEGLLQRMVFYGCELYAGQVKSRDEYEDIRPVYTIWLITGILWPEATAVHHAFRLTDKGSGRVLDGTLEIHTLELAKYNVRESELRSAGELDCWLFWLLHAHEYEPEELMKLLPQPAIRQATDTLPRISQITEDKAMYDAREKALRDRKWEIAARERKAHREGKIEGKIEGKVEGKIEGKIEGKVEGKIDTIHVLQRLLYLPLGDARELGAMSLEELEAMSSDLQEKLRSRSPS